MVIREFQIKPVKHTQYTVEAQETQYKLMEYRRKLRNPIKPNRIDIINQIPCLNPVILTSAGLSVVSLTTNVKSGIKKTLSYKCEIRKVLSGKPDIRKTSMVSLTLEKL